MLKKIACVISLFFVSFVSLSAKASDEVIYVESGRYEVTVKQGIEVNTYDTSGSAGWEWRRLPVYRSEGTSYNVDFSFTVDGFSALERSYIEKADTVKVDFVFGSGAFGSGHIGVIYMGEQYGSLSVAVPYIRFNFSDQSTATVEFDYSYEQIGFSLDQTDAKAVFSGGFNGRSVQDLQLGFKVIMNPNGTEGEPALVAQNIAATITCTYSDGTDKVIVINKEIYDKLGGIQDDINSGFSDVNNKLDSVISPDQNDQDAANGFLDKVEDNKQDAADINDQLSSVSRPDPGNLRDEVSPDQYIDKDDASVQEMSSLIASVFDIDVMVRYILVLLGLGLISLVFFGKKDG